MPFYVCRRVLHVVELARKLETEKEQIVPFDVARGTAGENRVADNSASLQDPTMLISGYSEVPESNTMGIGLHAASTMKQNAAGAPPGINVPQSTFQTSVTTVDNKEVLKEDRLQNFHRKYNTALLDCLAIEKEKMRLVEENAQLQDLISQFINGTRVSDEILSGDNPLFVINGR
jgi:hypothetical protein